MPSPAPIPTDSPIRTGLVGVGKMGVSHLAIANAHPRLELAAVCDTQGFLLAGLRSQVEIETFKSFEQMIDEARLDAVFVATPTSSHPGLADLAVARGLHLFVEKPLTLSATESRRLADEAQRRGVVNQVGYHNRFVGTFRETVRLVAGGAIGEVYHIDGRAFGPVVTTPQGGGRTWRSSKSEGGGCLHDYACHVIDLMNSIVGRPEAVIGANLAKVYSSDVEDVVHAIFTYPGGTSGTLETNWSDESYRKMTTSVTIYGTHGKLYADRQECRLFLKPDHHFEEFEDGWTIRYITELQEPVDYYLRGEEYSSQLDAFADAIGGGDSRGASTFSEAADADWVVEEIERVHRDGPAQSSHLRRPDRHEVASRVRSVASRASSRVAQYAKAATRRLKERRR